MILAAVGKNASGKDYFLDIISRQFNIPVISFGDCARELADKEGLAHTRENLQYISHKYMSTYGQDFFPKMMVEKIKNMGDVDVLVSGIRPPSDVENFKAAFGDDFFLVGIVVESDRQRWERTVARGSARDKVTFEQFLELDKHEEELFNTSKTMSMADYSFIRGDFSDEVYHEMIKKFYSERFL
jgi:dephospho-CoA kinase